MILIMIGIVAVLVLDIVGLWWLWIHDHDKR